MLTKLAEVCALFGAQPSYEPRTQDQMALTVGNPQTAELLARTIEHLDFEVTRSDGVVTVFVEDFTSKRKLQFEAKVKIFASQRKAGYAMVYSYLDNSFRVPKL